MRLRTLVVGSGVVALAGWAALAWPRINDVETGRTPEYPDLQPHSYSAAPEQVVRAVEDALRALPRWEMVGKGAGQAGAALHAVHTTRVLRFQDEVTIKVRREGGKSIVSVRSRSRVGAWDFGQNARNVRELLAELDARLPR